MVLLRTLRKPPVPIPMPPPQLALVAFPVVAFPVKTIPSRNAALLANRPPPSPATLPPETVKPVRVRVGASELRTRKAVAAPGSRRMVRLAAPGPVMVKAPPAAGSCGSAVSRDMVLGVLNTAGSKTMVSAAAVPLAVVIARRKLPVPASLTLVTIMVAGVDRSSRFSTSSRGRRLRFWDRRLMAGRRAKALWGTRDARGIMARVLVRNGIESMNAGRAKRVKNSGKRRYGMGAGYEVASPL